VLVSILHSVDFTFKSFEFATNILAKGLKYRNVSNVSYFKFLAAKKEFVRSDWLFVRSKLVLGLTNDLLIDENYLQACDDNFVISHVKYKLALKFCARIKE